MKAVGYKTPLPIEDDEALMDIDVPCPQVSGRDVLVQVKAIAVNPIEYKLRQTQVPKETEYRILGWDAVGEVVEVGPDVQRLKVGDQVYYAGDVNRQGCHAEYQLVDERLVGYKPKRLADAEAAALPLSTITAWELLFDHLGLQQQPTGSNTSSNEVLLVVGAAGGVGSILLQLAKAITGATVIATASRPESKDWVTGLGADYVVNHRKPLDAQIEALGVGTLTHVASLNATSSYFETYISLLSPFGKIGMIDNPAGLDMTKTKPKSLSLHTEYMFARSTFQAPDMDAQAKLLDRVADLIDQGHIKTTLGEHLGVIKAENIRKAHQKLEAGISIGKLVMAGFE